MPSESSERKGTKANQAGAPPSEPEQLQCPRCQSTNTKFCYYNNYNFSQPRHFCKACRRYWTRGGTLRDIPVGGGSRKNAKRSRTLATSATSSPSSCSANSTYEYRRATASTSQLLAPLAADHGGSLPLMNTDATTKHGSSMCGSFTSLLNTHGPAFFTLGGFGLGLGTGVDEMGFGLGRSVWPFPGIAVADGGAAGPGGASVLGNTWQLQSGEAGIVGGGDCFTLSDVAISTTGHVFK